MSIAEKRAESPGAGVFPVVSVPWTETGRWSGCGDLGCGEILLVQSSPPPHVPSFTEVRVQASATMRHWLGFLTVANRRLG